MDEFATVARKYQLMFGLTEASVVLLSGDCFTSKAAEFGRAFDHVSCEHPAVGAEASPRYDLICMDGRSLPAMKSITDAVAARLAQLSQGGSLVLALTNRHALDHMVARFRGRIAPRVVAHTPSAARAGFRRSQTVVDEYFVNPSLNVPDEFVRSRGTEIELPSYSSTVHRIAARIGAYHFLHADMLMVATKDSTLGMRTIPDIVERGLGLPTHSLRIERFALRERGALILLLGDRTGSHSLVVRVAAEAVTDMLVRNADLTDSLLDSWLPAPFRHLVPRTLLRLPHRGGVIFVEERRPGTLAWKVAQRVKVAPRLFSDALQFAMALDSGTRHGAHMDDAGFARVAGDSIQAIRMALLGSPDAAAALHRIEHALRNALLGRNIDLVVGHGDYGYGNLLCAPRTGALTGVVDWDTHVRDELPGVDLCNLILQDASSRRAGDIEMAFSDASVQCANDSRLAEYPLGSMSGATDAWRLRLVLAAVRLVHRSTRYQKEFARARESHIRLLRRAAASLGQS